MTFTKQLLLLTLLLISSSSFSQSPYQNRQHQFLSFEKIPTWVGVASNWKAENPQVHLYDPVKYKGHAQFISVGLKTGINFQQFKAQVRTYDSRKYMPFFLFDLRDMPLNLEGFKYDWAVRIEDYRYTDNQQQLAEEAVKLMNTIAAYIQKESGKASKGIIILATASQATPNTAIARSLTSNGYPNLTRSQLLERVGGKRVEILNAGKGIGYLKYVPAGQEKTFRASTKDILIYENLPDRVPPVSGIITLTPQTPLSHINLLAKNRGTINLYATKLTYLPNATALLNKLVKIDCDQRKISISLATEAEAKVYWANRATKVEIPQAYLAVTSITNLNKKSSIQTVRHVGAKAANYARIRQLLPAYVRKGYAIPFAHYFEAIKSTGADRLIQKLIKEKPVGIRLAQQLTAIRTQILTAKLNPTLLREVNSIISNQYANAKIRLRSSTNCEDLAEFNGAGLYESKGFKIKDGNQKLAKKILKVFASLWNQHAYEEREFFLIDHSKAGMAILINQAFPDEYANGVAITMKETGKLRAYINTQYGENSVTNPKSGQIPETLYFTSAYRDTYELRSESNIHAIFLQNELNEQLIVLRKSLLSIHQLLTSNLQQKGNATYGADIEFKLMNEAGTIKLYIKQARLLRVILPN